MLDVHPPHTATHTWRDFFIHIATIVVGLLIAVGLEQTVEYLHHREQLHQLRQDLRAESLRNLHVTRSNIEFCEARVASEAALYQELLTANREHRPPVLHNTSPGGSPIKPAYAVWTVAQQNGTLGLLPRAEAQAYVRSYSTVQYISDAFTQRNTANSSLRSALMPGTVHLSPEQRTLDPGAQESATWAALDPQDFREARNRLADTISADQYIVNRNLILYVTEWMLLHGISSDEEMARVTNGVVASSTRGDIAAVLARYPLPPDEKTLPAAPER